MAGIGEVQSVIEGVVADRLAGAVRVRFVDVREGVDGEGEDILVVRVVYDAGSSSLDPKRLAGLARHIRSKLSDAIAEERFPLLSFVSDREVEAAAA